MTSPRNTRKMAQGAGPAAAPWRARDAHDAFPDGAFGDLLAFDGSLTARLDALCGGRFELALLAQGELAAEDVDTLMPYESPALLPALCREVLMSAAGEPVVFARTLVPRSTLARQDWLADLGGSSLGHALFVREDVTRSAFEFACLGTGSPVHRRLTALVPAMGALRGPLWVRHSCFAIDGAPVVVMESFLPAAHDLAAARAGAVPGPADD
jgi:chorismate--pyruvate lyase